MVNVRTTVDDQTAANVAYLATDLHMPRPEVYRALITLAVTSLSLTDLKAAMKGTAKVQARILFKVPSPVRAKGK